jgi:hypothetical protein
VAGCVVIGRDLQKVGVISDLRIVIRRTVKRAERCVLDDVKAERFVRSKRFRGSVEL